MRLSAELIGSIAEQRTNPMGEREIVLRGLNIPVIEHLGVTRDMFDAIDFTDNRISAVTNFPKLSRLSTLYMSGNIVDTIDHRNLSKNVPNIKYLDLSSNHISSLYEISQLGTALPKLEVLNLVNNPVQSK
jgi:U2 small nuclear ribonucleoprotein A'